MIPRTPLWVARIGLIAALVPLAAACQSTADGKGTYLAARRALEENRNDDALATYATLQHDQGRYGESGLLDSGYAALRRGDPLAARAIAARYIELYPESEKLPYAITLMATARYAVLRDSPDASKAEIEDAITELLHVNEAYPAVAPPEVIDDMVAELRKKL
jgi:outer membrane protein assembly factor BamD (BamD/ComL family)